MADSPKEAALRQQVQRLELIIDGLAARLERVEAQLALVPAQTEGLQPAKPVAKPAPRVAIKQTPPIADDEDVIEWDEEEEKAPSAPAVARNWEKLIGGQWALYIGSSALFLSVAFFLAYAWHFLGPGTRVAGGLVLGLALVAGGIYTSLAKRTEGWFGAGLAGAGLGVLYLNTWTAYQVHGLIGGEGVVVGLAATTALGVYLALRYNAPSLSIVASVGGFLTPLVMRGGALIASESVAAGGLDLMSLQIYAAILNFGLLGVAVTKRQTALSWICLGGTVALCLAMEGMTSHPWQSLAFTAVYFAQFAVTACCYSLRKQEQTSAHDLHMLITCSSIFTPAGYLLIREELGVWRVVYPLLLAAIAGVIWAGGRLMAPANTTFRAAAAGLGIFYLTVAVPVQLEQGWLGVAWVVETTILESLALLIASPLLARFALWVAVPAFVAIVLTVCTQSADLHVPLFNERALPLTLVPVAAAWLVFWTRHCRRPPGAGPGPLLALGGAAALTLGFEQLVDWQTFGHFFSSPFIALPTSALLAAFAAAIYRLGLGLGDRAMRLGALPVATWAAVSLFTGDPQGDLAPGAEARFACFAIVAIALAVIGFMGHWRREDLAPEERNMSAALPLVSAGIALWDATLETWSVMRAIGGTDWQRLGHLGISLVWITAGVFALLGGVHFGARPFRLLGLALLGLTVGKVFLVDLAFLDTPMRILSFGGLGIALIGISWLYGRFGVGDTESDKRPASKK